MNDYQIDYFLSAAKHRNFTKAAEEHFTSQPTVSRQVALLEEELGVTLFFRDRGGGIRLTPGGVVMAREFQKMRRDLKAAIERTARVSAGLEGKIAIGCLAGLNRDMFVWPLLSEFAKRCPGVSIKIESATFSVLRQKLEKGEFDIIHTYNFELPSLGNVIHEKAYATSQAIVMASSHPLAERENLNLSLFSGETFLLPDMAESPGRGAAMLAICAGLGIKDISIKTVESVESMLFGIRRNAGIGFVSTANDLFFDDHYFCFMVPETGVETWIAAVWNAENLNPVIPLYTALFPEIRNIDVFLSSPPPRAELDP